MRAIRWLFLKDLKILWRSPVAASVLVVYPVAVALLIGFALDRGPDKPTVAVLNQVPAGEAVQIGSERFDQALTGAELRKRVHSLNVHSRAEAERKVRDGDALAALIIPADTVRKVESQLDQPQIELLVNEEDPVKGRLVDDAISSVIAGANRRFSAGLTRTSLQYLNLLLKGGTVNVLGNEFRVLGLRRIGAITRAAKKELPARSPVRAQLDQVIRFNELAQQNFGLGAKALAAISEPIKVHKEVLKGGRVPLSSFAAAVAVAISLMFVAVLLASGSLALERTENVFTRLVRGPVSRVGLLAEKALLAAAAALAVSLLMVLVLAPFVSLAWGRFPLWLAALVLGGLACGALGTAIGTLARDVSTASLVAFAVLLPIAFLALVPSGVVSPWLYDTSRAVSAAFPFRPTLRAVESAIYDEGGLAGPLLHLALLCGVFGLASRLALRRLA